MVHRKERRRATVIKKDSEAERRIREDPNIEFGKRGVASLGGTPKITVSEPFPTPLSPEEKEEKAIVEEQFFEPREQFQKELEAKIVQPPSLEPPPVLETAAGVGLAPSVGIGNFITGVLEDITGKQFGRTSTKELAGTKGGKALGLAIDAVGVATVIAMGSVAAGFLAQKAAQTTIVTKVGLSTGSLKAVIFTGFALGGAASILDVERGEITTAKNRIARITEQGERLLGATASGLPIPFTFAQLGRMNNSVNEAEATIKQKGIFNIKFRTSKEYLDLEEDIVDARIALVRRLEELEEVARTGTRPTDPEELILLAEDFP